MRKRGAGSADPVRQPEVERWRLSRRGRPSGRGTPVAAKQPAEAFILDDLAGTWHRTLSGALGTGHESRNERRPLAPPYG